MAQYAKTACVVASNRAEGLGRFLDAWSPAPWDLLVVVEDGPERTFDFDMGDRRHHVSWREIDDDPLVPDPALFSRRDSAIKCYGFALAVRLGATVVVSLDDDCYPLDPTCDGDRWLAGHLAALGPRPRWVPSIDGVPTRGVPYYETGATRSPLVNMGTWHDVADLDAPQSLAALRASGPGALAGFVPPEGNRLVHPEHYWPFCGMNIAFRAPALPLMYFPRMGEGVPYRRFDDIWAGVLMQRVARHCGALLACGDPPIRHIRASNVLVNLVKEAPGIAANEVVWRVVDQTPLDGARTLPAAVRALGAALADPGGRGVDPLDFGADAALDGYLRDLGVRLGQWCDLISRSGCEVDS